MGRKNRRNRDENKPISDGAIYGFSARVETKRGVEYQVRRTLRGQCEYKCPHCNGVIPVGATSITVIETDHFFGPNAAVEDRRHWHDACWRRFK
jgi:hypothetical protein